ncbi:MAG: poly-A polymerase [Spirochaetia bacterium]|nr:poly-A polymerase [Spirochaetia bacterium]
MQRPDLLKALPAIIQNDIAVIHKTLRVNGFECYLVGGCVRDLLLGRSVKDLDFTTNAEPSSVQSIFKRTVPTGIKHGTITVLLEDRSYEVTTYRAESDYSDARRPDRITFAKTLSEDLSRRDFTINALALDPDTGSITDEHGGLDDLEKRILRTIGKPEERFFEDGLRTVRACRFASVLGFTIEPGTLAALSLPEIQKRTALVAIERFTDELWKGFSGKTVSGLIQHLEGTGLLDLFVRFPGTKPETTKTTPEILSKLDQIRSAENRMGIWLSHFFPLQSAERSIEPVCKKLKFSGSQMQYCQTLTRVLAFALTAQPTPNIADQRRFCARLKKELASPIQWLEEIEEIERVEPIASMILQFKEILTNDPLLPTDLKIDGNDLKSLGFEGRLIGQKIDQLLTHVYKDPGVNTREKLIELLQAN